MSYKILFVLTPALHPNAGGVQMSTVKLGRHFSARGHDVAAFSFALNGHDKAAPFRLFHANEPGGQTPANLNRLAQVIDRFEPDVVINQMPYEHRIGRVLRENKRYLLLGCLRNTLYSVKANLDAYIDRAMPSRLVPLFRNPLGRGLFLARHRRRHRSDLLRILDTYDHFVMFGPPNLEELRYFVPEFDQSKIRLIPNSIPAVADTPPPKEKRLLWLGRVAHEQKRAELIVPIWQRLCHELPDWHLDVVGDGPALNELRRQAGEQNLPRIHFHGRQMPEDFYRRSPIFFMTSAFEGFPNTLVEAQSHAAIPVIFDSYPVAAWIVEDGRSGRLVRPFDTEAMARCILELTRQECREAMADQVLANARRFHIGRVGDLWQQLFEAEVPKHVQRRETEPAA